MRRPLKLRELFIRISVRFTGKLCSVFHRQFSICVCVFRMLHQRTILYHSTSGHEALIKPAKKHDVSEMSIIFLVILCIMPVTVVLYCILLTFIPIVHVLIVIICRLINFALNKAQNAFAGHLSWRPVQHMI